MADGSDLSDKLSSTHRAWSWTIGSKTQDIHLESPQEYIQQLKTYGAVYAVVGVEKGSKTGYKHWQCAALFGEEIEFDRVRVIAAIKDFVPASLKWHVPKTKKWYNAVTYCKKDSKYHALDVDNNTVVESVSGSIERDCVDKIRAGYSIDQLDDEHPYYVYKNLRKLRDYVNYQSYKRARYDPSVDYKFESLGLDNPR